MQTAAIGYRVADFLRRHPPFQCMDEADALALTVRGRVKFHESDEYLCWQGKPHGPHVFVIQQGTVSIWEDTAAGEQLRDIRGPGDVIGIERFNGAAAWPYSAKSASDVVIYALPAADLQPLLERYPQAARYVAAHSTFSAGFHAADQRRGVDSLFAAERGRPARTCGAGSSLREAAARIEESGSGAAVVLDRGKVAGVVTAHDIVRWVAQGTGDPASVTARGLLRHPAITVAPNAPVVECALAMAHAGVEAAAITSDGSPAGAVHAVVTAADLAPAFGDHPSAILREIARAADTRTLHWLNQRARAFLLEHLDAPSSVDWLANFSDLANTAIVRRLCELLSVPLEEVCVCFHGAAGRRELLTAQAPGVAIIGPSLPLLDGLRECGFLDPAAPEHGAFEEWRDRFAHWIRDPIAAQAWRGLPLFDMRPVLGRAPLWDELGAAVEREIAASRLFVPLMAHDCLSSLPPLTFFQDMVVDESGEHTDVFELERTALRPLVNVGRVFGLACGSGLGGSTSERLRHARALLPERDAVFREAAETLRVVLYHQARAGIRSQSNGDELPPALLSRHDRQVLKSCFRSILKLLEFTSGREWLERR